MTEAGLETILRRFHGRVESRPLSPETDVAIAYLAHLEESVPRLPEVTAPLVSIVREASVLAFAREHDAVTLPATFSADQLVEAIELLHHRGKVSAQTNSGVRAGSSSTT